MTSFVLKIIACITMLLDHIGKAFFPNLKLFNYIGRLALPIFAFQISEGYIHTKNLKKYFQKLILFALISQIPFMLLYKLVFNSFAINVIFTLLFGLIAITIYDKKNKILGLISAILLGFLAQKLHFDYGAYGISIVFLFFVFKENPLFNAISFCIATIIKYFASVIPYGFNTFLKVFTSFNQISLSLLSTMFAVIPIAFYNGKKGRDMKYFLYLFYPIHLLIISLFLILIN